MPLHPVVAVIKLKKREWLSMADESFSAPGLRLVKWEIYSSFSRVF